MKCWSILEEQMVKILCESDKDPIAQIAKKLLAERVVDVEIPKNVAAKKW